MELLDDPGSADLSAYVDFGALRQAVHQAAADTKAQQLKGGLQNVPSVAQCYGPITQNQLLHAMGIHLRAQALAQVRLKVWKERIYSRLGPQRRVKARFELGRSARTATSTPNSFDEKCMR